MVAGLNGILYIINIGSELSSRNATVKDYTSRINNTCPAQIVKDCTGKASCDFPNCTPSLIQYACTAELYPTSNITGVSTMLPLAPPLVDVL